MSAKLHNDPKPGDFMCEHCYTHFKHESGELKCQQCGNVDRSTLLPIEVPKKVEAEDLESIEKIVGENIVGVNRGNGLESAHGGTH